MRAPEHWEMERIKRRLDRFAPLVAPAREVALLGLPSPSDVEGQFRVEGLESLLAAHGIARRPGGAVRSAVVIWLGDAPEELEALRHRRGPTPGKLFLWPRPEQAAGLRKLLGEWNGTPPVFCLPSDAVGDPAAGRVHVLPDPAHALWGLLDHHPRGEGLLDLPESGWDGLLPPARVEMLRRSELGGYGLRLGSLGLGLQRAARRRVLEAARRAVAAHAAVSGTRTGGSILAALLGRGFRAAPAAGQDGAAARIAAYWAEWRAMVAVVP